MSDRTRILFSSSTALGFSKIRDDCVSIQKILVDYEQSDDIEYAAGQMIAVLVLATSDLMTLEEHLKESVFDKSIVRSKKSSATIPAPI